LNEPGMYSNAGAIVAIVLHTSDWPTSCGTNTVAYWGGFADANYESVRFVQDAGAPDTDALVDELQMKAPHAKTLRKAWAALGPP